MRAKATVFTVLLLVSFYPFTLCLAQEQGMGKAEMEELRKQIIELQAKVKEMEERHGLEIEALHRQIQDLSQTREKKEEEEEEIDRLRQLAEAQAAKEERKEQLEETEFKAGALSLQALNPEISVTGDMLYTYRDQEDTRKRSDFKFRTLGVHLESYLDPYSRFKAAIPITEDEAKIGEAYFTRFGILENLNLTVGKFRQQFGVVNRWHKHGLDQIDFPLALRSIFGNGGLNQTGVSLDWTLPARGDVSQELTLQITDGENDRLFGGNSKGYPSTLLHYKNYRDLSKDTYLEFGFSGLLGWNDEWDILAGQSTQEARDTLSTWVLGADLSLLWEPTERMRYRNLEWRSEAYFLNQDILAPDGSGKDTLNAWGAYSYLQGKLSRDWEIGIRGDYYEPDTEDYAELPGLSLTPLAYSSGEAYRWGLGPYVTWYQSPFVRARLTYEHFDGQGMEKFEDAVTLQLIFAAGPHKHERY